MQDTEYLTAEIAANTKYKSVTDGYERNYFGVVRVKDMFYIESSGCPDRTYNLVIKETKRLYPNLRYIYD